MSDIESPLKFPNPMDDKYWKYNSQTDLNDFNGGKFQEDYESCLIELGLIMEKVYDPVLRKKLDDLMRGVKEWLT